MDYLIGFCAVVVIVCALYRLRQMRAANRRKETSKHWDDFLCQLDQWEREHCIKTTERIRIGLEFNEVSSRQLKELCEWVGKDRCRILCNALALYYFAASKLHEEKGVSIIISDEDGEAERINLVK